MDATDLLNAHRPSPLSTVDIESEFYDMRQGQKDEEDLEATSPTRSNGTSLRDQVESKHPELSFKFAPVLSSSSWRSDEYALGSPRKSKKPSRSLPSARRSQGRA